MNKEVLPESHKLFKETFQQSWDEISKDVRTKIAKRFFNGDNMKPADLLLKRALEALHGCSPSDAFNLRAEIRAFLAAEPKAEPEPVAWLWLEKPSKQFPVYLHPPKPEPARKPMTEVEVMTGYGKLKPHGLVDFALGIRFAEKHHFGIGINKSDSDSIDLQSRCRGDKL